MFATAVQQELEVTQQQPAERFKVEILPRPYAHDNEWRPDVEDLVIVMLNGSPLKFLKKSARIAFTDGSVVVKLEAYKLSHSCYKKNESQVEYENYQHIPDEYKHLFAEVYTHGEDEHYRWVVMEYAGECVWDITYGPKYSRELQLQADAAATHIRRVVDEINSRGYIELEDISYGNIGYNIETKQAKVYDIAGYRYD